MTDPDSVRRFEALVLPHMNSAYNVARWLTHNEHDAEDVMQEAYLRAFRYFGGFRGGDARAWLLSIVRNAFYTWLEQNGARAAQAEPYDEDRHGAAAPATDAGPEAEALRGERSRHVHAALRRLDLEYREIIVLRELEDLSYREIAVIAGIPIGTVMSRLSRGREKLAALLAPLNEGP